MRRADHGVLELALIEIGAGEFERIAETVEYVLDGFAAGRHAVFDMAADLGDDRGALLGRQAAQGAFERGEIGGEGICHEVFSTTSRMAMRNETQADFMAPSVSVPSAVNW
ncbi:hypothetical protein GCM10008942_04660 [Rhizomicrobium electricum]|uniref:Uncharacterized protein n=1 Tax=Rhizomicrobium electricum TaxID=480070 RepID=A0ABN1E5N9_9PROT